MSHLKFTTASALALVHEIAGLAVGLGVLNASTQGVVVTIAVSAVNLGGLIANAIHHHADMHVDPKQVEQNAIAAATAEIGKVDFNGLAREAIEAHSAGNIEQLVEQKVQTVFQRAFGSQTTPAPAPVTQAAQVGYQTTPATPNQPPAG
jgi:Na+/H+-dicarboxylate symporter